MTFVDSPEKAKADSALTVLSYQEDQFRQFFTSPFDQYKDRIGQSFTVFGHDEKAEKEVVADGGNFEEMYLIRFEDNTEITAWGHEVCLLNYDECK